MKTLEQLQVERKVAAAAWLAAVDTLRATYVELSAYDRAVTSGRVHGEAAPCRTFNTQLEEIPAHPDFILPAWPNQGDKIRSRLEALLR
ncbi:hypothetical protein [Pseudomonas putida]|uniref:hypothetical protein n=1 Tax=Pseudomonas putida TaxID=303 RepID=UPI003D966A28